MPPAKNPQKSVLTFLRRASDYTHTHAHTHTHTLTLAHTLARFTYSIEYGVATIVGSLKS